MRGAWPHTLTESAVIPRVLRAPEYRSASWMLRPVGAPRSTPGPAAAAAVGTFLAAPPGLRPPAVEPAAAPAPVAAATDASVVPADESPPDDPASCAPALFPDATELAVVVPRGVTATEYSPYANVHTRTTAETPRGRMFLRMLARSRSRMS